VPAIAFCEWGYGLGIGSGQCCLRLAQCGRDMGHLFNMGLSELLEVNVTKEGTIRRQIECAMGRVQLGNVVLDDLAKLWTSLRLPLSGFMQRAMPAWCSTMNSSVI
jgi:hypothetical protein